MNKAILLGRLVRDPEVRYFEGKTGAFAKASFTLAVDRPRQKDKPKEADFIPCVLNGKQAETVGNYCQKGKQIIVEGRIQVRNYDGKDGVKHYVTEVVVERFEFTGDKGSGAIQPKTNGGFESMGEVSDEFFGF